MPAGSGRWPVAGLLVILCAARLAALDVHNGDFVFQSLPHAALIDAIEAATASPWSHCGIVVVDGDSIQVIEAIGPVQFTDFKEWQGRGRDGKIAVTRLKDASVIPAMIAQAKTMLGKPYDIHYAMDDEKIYCSELIYKSFLLATRQEIAAPVALGDLNWQPAEQVIRSIEGGALPLDRIMVTPVAVAKSTLCEVIYDDFAEKP